MKYFKIFSLITLFLLTSACSTLETSFTKTGDIEAAPLSSNCKVSLYTTNPKKDFDELGIIDIQSFCYPFVGCPETRKASFVKKILSTEVCKQGGNALLLWETNGAGFYMKATVIKTK